MPNIIASPEVAAAERFRRETAGHVMTVLHDDGLYRHLRFANPKSDLYWYEITTTPGQLTFSGDGESFVFRAAPDMFEMFRRSAESGGINATYWSEKCRSGNEFSYSRELFEAHVWKAVTAAEPQYRELRENVQKEIFDSESFNVDYEADALFAALNFVHYLRALPKAGDPHPAPFTFRRIHDWDLRDFDWWFLFACHAIRNAIAQYDAAKPVADATLTEYGIAILDAGVEVVTNVTTDRDQALSRQAHIRTGYPLARLVSRTVTHGEWTEVAA